MYCKDSWMKVSRSEGGAQTYEDLLSLKEPSLRIRLVLVILVIFFPVQTLLLLLVELASAIHWNLSLFYIKTNWGRLLGIVGLTM